MIGQLQVSFGQIHGFRIITPQVNSHLFPTQAETHIHIEMVWTKITCQLQEPDILKDKFHLIIRTNTDKLSQMKAEQTQEHIKR